MVNTTMSPNSTNYEGDTGSVKANVVVAVRFRPLSNRERDRGDVEVWECQGNEVGILDDAAGMQVKFAYDYVFDGSTSNSDVYRAVAAPIVSGAMEGLSGTVFAYGVTSSGKTHTMMGDESVPGVVPHAIADVFAAVARHGGEKEYSLKVSMMEIYNEVLNDLLDPARINLKLREDPKRGGVLAEGILEEPLSNVHQALAVISRGNENRKTSATAFNEGSSRSHTIIRLQIEARQAPGAAGGAGSRVVSCLNLIDLAGSESAKAERTASHRMEGSFINKSLLTLGTVIHKLADSRAAHIPFRDSKLTRLLSGSLSGTGARVAVVCTITPASTQAEETHNTLKFASRAKRISITVHKNEIVDQSSLISRYQQEIAVLRSQLEHARGPEGACGAALLAGPRDPLDPEVRTLRERLEEERLVAEAQEGTIRSLHARVRRLARCVLQGAAASTHADRRLRAALKAQDVSAALSFGRGFQAPGAVGSAWAGASPRTAEEATPLPSWVPTPSTLADAPAAADLARGAGDLFAGSALAAASRSAAAAARLEADVLRDQVEALARELAEREDMLATLRDLGGGRRAREEGGDDVAVQVMLAEREFMQAQIAAADGHSDKLARALERMRARLAGERGVDPESIDFGLDEDDEEEEADEGGDRSGKPLKLRTGYDHVLAEKVLALEDKVGLAIDALRRKEEQLSTQRAALVQLSGLEGANAGELEEARAEASALRVENSSLKVELARLEAQADHVQGYSLDGLDHEELGELIQTLTQAVERVRITVQLRRLTHAKRVSPVEELLGGGGEGGGMSREDMRAALEQLAVH